MDSTDDRPAWVPSHASWVNGLWYVNGKQIFDPGQPAPELAADRRARLIAEDTARLAKTRTGLPTGHYRHCGLIYGPNGKIAVDLPGGYVDDGSWLPGHAEAREARKASMIKAQAAEHKAIAAMEVAIQARHEAAARAFQASNVMVEE